MTSEKVYNTGIQMRHLFLVMIVLVSTILFIASIVMITIGYLNPFGTIGFGILGGGCVIFFSAILFLCMSSIWLKNKYFADENDYDDKLVVSSHEDVSLMKPASNSSTSAMLEEGRGMERDPKKDNDYPVPLYSVSTVLSSISSSTSTVPEQVMQYNWADNTGEPEDSDVFTSSLTATQHSGLKAQQYQHVDIKAQQEHYTGIKSQQPNYNDIKSQQSQESEIKSQQKQHIDIMSQQKQYKDIKPLQKQYKDIKLQQNQQSEIKAPQKEHRDVNLEQQPKPSRAFYGLPNPDLTVPALHNNDKSVSDSPRQRKPVVMDTINNTSIPSSGTTTIPSSVQSYLKPENGGKQTAKHLPDAQSKTSKLRSPNTNTQICGRKNVNHVPVPTGEAKIATPPKFQDLEDNKSKQLFQGRVTNLPPKSKNCSQEWEQTLHNREQTIQTSDSHGSLLQESNVPIHNATRGNKQTFQGVTSNAIYAVPVVNANAEKKHISYEKTNRINHDKTVILMQYLLPKSQ